MLLAVAAGIAFALSLIGSTVIVRRRLGLRGVAAGEERWRSDAVPRIGGLAMAVGFAVGAAIAAAGGRVDDRRTAGFIGAAALMAGLGLYDDLRGMKPLGKVIGQILAAAILLATGTTVEIIDVEPLSSAMTFVWVILISNAFNLLDNMDGLAAGVGIVSAVLLAVHASIAGLPDVVTMAVLVAAVIAGFLPLNFRPRAKAALFMGDSGSQLLGFSLAWLALAASWHEASGLVAAIAVPLLVLAVPILDTMLVSVVRLIEGRPIHEGGRDHTSHQLVIYGLSEKRAVLLLVGAAGVLGGSSLLYVEYGHLLPALVGLGLSLALLAHFALFLIQARRAAQGIAPRAVDTDGGWLSIETYRLHKRRLLEGLIDLVLIVAAYYIAYVLRYDRLPDDLNSELIAESLPFLVAARYGAFLYFGLYRGLWRYAGTRDVARAFLAVVVSEAVAVAALTLVFRFDGYSRSVFVIDAVVCFVLIAGSRLAERGLGEWLQGQRDRRGLPVAVIVGAGAAGHTLLRELRRRGEHVVAGFVDDDPAKHGMRSQGVRVLGGHQHIELILDRYRPEVLYVTIPDAPPDRLRRIETACGHAGVRCTSVRTFEGVPARDAHTGNGAGSVQPA
ncbi:MAG: hypothetical protein AB1416_02115 [Actinomycetota bacterium]